ncbi:M28 family metallopeptidase [Pedobacter sp. SYP-B3415]|uniref:M28 family metallopeptidase n=1 Tax=Pedobacter sp. SYP-B3415 TaxID=2496641 RepID=UPI00101BCA6B|nr:M28 family peptidase [Pedobacter sp. SYP-B3415]
MFSSTRLFIFLFFLSATQAIAQDRPQTIEQVKTLSSEAFWGRGYTRDGMKKAAAYIAKNLEKSGVAPMNGPSYLQHFSYPVNTFPGAMELRLNGKSLVPGLDFLVGNESTGQRIENASLEKKDSVTYLSAATKTIFVLQNKLTWSVSSSVEPYTVIYLDRTRLKTEPENFSMNIENRFLPAFEAANVCGMVRGTRRPDSVLVLSAHYDHLGSMGSNTWFPGANDNASGVATLLSLARHYAENPPAYSIAFLFFAGEEAGLIGSKYFTENPLVPLSSIRFLLNLDLVGTGVDGATVVNATVYPEAFAELERINNSGNLFSKLARRGKAANSDHYHFSEKNVPAFFLYTMGGTQAYHDINDKAETLPMGSYEQVFKLITGFFSAQMDR